MKVGFFGTPDIASYVLQRLCREHEVVFLVAPEDKRCGRNLKVQHCSSKEIASCENIPVLQPASLRDPEFAAELEGYGADIYVVVAYGKLIPGSIFRIPRLGTINLHPSLLPLYRGAAPVEWSIINGERETGVTVQMINEELDAGDIVVQKSIALDGDITSGELYEIVMPVGEELVVQAIDILDEGSRVPQPQEHGEATYCAKIDRDTAGIDWSLDAERIHNLVRGLNPKPAAWTTFREKNMKIWRTSRFEEPSLSLEPGELFRFMKKHLLVGTGTGILEILEIQPENRKRMDGLAFINGYRLSGKERFV